MNILILNWRDPKNPESGGAEIATLEHAKAWVAKGHTVTWYTSDFLHAKRKEYISGVKILRFGHRYLIYLLAPFVYMLTGKYDAVIDEIHGIPFFTPFYVRKPRVAFIHEVAGEIWDHMFRFPVNKIGKFLEQSIFVVYKNEKFITVSESTKAELVKEGIKKNNVYVIKNGINVVPLKKLPQKETVPTYIFVSRLVRMKGIEDVLRAFSIIKNRQKAANLWIVGDGESTYVASLKMLVNEYGLTDDVHFKGYVSEGDKYTLLQKAHLLLHASVKEGWGLVVTEAASQGTPAVVYDVAGLRDSVQDGKTGIVLKKNNSEEMAEQAVRLLDSKETYKSMQRACLEEAAELTWEKATRKSLDMLEQITDEKK